MSIRLRILAGGRDRRRGVALFLASGLLASGWPAIGSSRLESLAPTQTPESSPPPVTSPSSTPAAATATERAPIDRTLWAVPEPGAATSGIPAIEVLEQGQLRQLLATAFFDPQRTPWRILIYADLPFSTEAGTRTTAQWLDDAADRLVGLGDVQVAIGQAAPRQLGAPTRDAAQLRLQLDELAEEAEEAGALIEARRSLLGQEAPDARDILEIWYEEQELLEWQQNAAEDWILGAVEDRIREDLAAGGEPVSWTAATARPRLLLLIRDALDLDPTVFYRQRPGGAELERRLRADLERERRFARTLAAMGWRVGALRPPATEDADRAELLPGGDLAPELVEATGGWVIESAAALERAVAAMGSALAARYRTPLRDAEPYPVDLRSADAPGSLRSPRWATAVPPAALSLVRARRLIEDDESGSIRVESVLVGELSSSATVEAAVELASLDADPGVGTAHSSAGTAHSSAGTAHGTSDWLRVTVVSQRLDQDPQLDQHTGSGLELRGPRWVLRSSVETPDDLQEIVVVAEDLRTGAWGAARAEPAEVSVADETEDTVEVAGIPPPVERLESPAVRADVRERATAYALPGEPRQRLRRRTDAPFKIVPPRDSPLVGEKTFRILLTLEAVDRVVFELDGRQVAEDRRRPYEASIDLGPEAAPHWLRAVAYSAGDFVLGEDLLEINPARVREGITLTKAQPVGRGDAVDVVAELLLPPDAELDRVELYRNETLAVTMTRPPFATRVPGPARADADYVRAVAWLSDGSFLEDVWMLGSSATTSERIDVNLVEVYAVVTDRDGNPVRGLDGEDFRIRLGKQEVSLDRFSVADDVPLSLALAVDSSESMYVLMEDTRRAAARFLTELLKPIDQAFVVDFDDRPQLVHDTTGEVLELVASLRHLEASGGTAIYDAILFSLLHFQPGLGRKAVVLLTDGDDVHSRFSYRKTWQTVSSGSVPVYFVAMAGMDDERPAFRKTDLETLAEDSGGRVFYVDSMDKIGEAYASIGRELRSQYVLAFTTEGALSDKELDSIEVEILGERARKLEVRFAVGQR
ncbi:MAG TPA: VWA domain-containing protein [Thermoanaerobaculia bacterium]|nr:VWA domain-containing protein [Thermoanaerobaculia bacterium]